MADIREDNSLFSARCRVAGIGTTEIDTFLFKVGGSGFATIKQIHFSNQHTVTSFVRFRMYLNPTITLDGTSETVTPLDVGNGDSSGITVFSSPTIAARGNTFFDVIVPSGIAGSTLPIVFPPGFNLRASQNLLITAIGDAASRVASINIVWEE